jgi:hypothetical protein
MARGDRPRMERPSSASAGVRGDMLRSDDARAAEALAEGGAAAVRRRARARSA